MASTTSANGVAFHWFRKGLRVHDNPALAEAAASGKTVVPVFCIDPAFARTGKVGLVRYRFLLESLSDLDRSLRERGSRLLVLRGSPGEVLPPLFGLDGASSITWEHDTEPYAKARDAAIAAAAGDCGLRVGIHHSHTLHEVEALVAASKGKPPSTYRAFLGLMAKVGPPPRSQCWKRSPRVRKQATAWRARWWIQPSSRSCVMIASMNGYPVRPSSQAASRSSSQSQLIW